MQRISVTIGEDRQVKNQILKTYFFYVTETGFEKPVYAMPLDKAVKYGVYHHSNNTAKRESELIFDVKANINLKMFTSKTMFGRPKEYYNIYLELDDKAPLIQIHGLGEFGKFEGRATIRKENGIKDSELKRMFKYTIKAPALKKSNQSKDAPRKLLW